MTSPPTRSVSQQFLDQQFDAENWAEVLKKCTKVEFYNQPTPIERGQIPGTCTIGEKYYSPNGALTAVLIYYRRPDGKLGASGRPSVKGLLINGVWHYLGRLKQ